ncbi:MAG: thioredoxin [bacterium]
MALELSESTFQKEIIQGKGVSLVDFWAPWCGPCKMIAPVIDELAQEYKDKVKIAKVNVDNNMQISSQFSIGSIPTLLLFKDGKVVNQVVGLVSKAELKKRIDDVLS